MAEVGHRQFSLGACLARWLRASCSEIAVGNLPLVSALCAAVAIRVPFPVIALVNLYAVHHKLSHKVILALYLCQFTLDT